MSLVSTHNVRQTLLLQKVRDSTMAKADGTTTTERVTKSSGRIDTGTLLLLRGWVGPDTIGRHLLMILVLMFERGVDTGNVRDGQYVLNPSPLDGIANAALPTKSSSAGFVVVIVIVVLLFFFHVGNPVGYGTGNTTVDAEDVLIDDGRQGHPVEGLVGGLPHAISQLVAEPIAALPQETADAVVLLPVWNASKGAK
jgi:hypothetical protein